MWHNTKCAKQNCTLYIFNKIERTMRLRELFFLLLALPLTFAACKKSEAPQTAEYLYNVEMTKAERLMEIAEEGVTFEQNQFMLHFESENHGELMLLIQGEVGETALTAGTYKSLRGALVLNACAYMTEDESLHQFAEGSVTVALSDKVYTIEATFTNATDDKYHFTYKGEIRNMVEESKYYVEREITSAERLLPAERHEISEGDIGIAFIHGTYVLGMAFTPEQGMDIITAGTYSETLNNLKINECIYYNAANIVEQYRFTSGEVKVEGEVDNYVFDITLTDAEGRVFKFTYDGFVTYMMTRFENAECTSRCEGYCDGPDAYNYVVTFGRHLELPLGDPRTTSFLLCIYGPEVEKSADGYYRVPNGTYTFDKENFAQSGTIYGDSDYSYVIIGEMEELMGDATLVVTDEGATLTATILKKTTQGNDEIEYYFSYEGALLAREGDDFKAEYSE